MQNVLVVVGVSIAAFASTSVDNLLLILTFLANPHYDTRDALVGYSGATLTLLLAGLSASYIANFAPDHYVKYLGIIPIVLGIQGFYRLLRQKDSLPVPETRRAKPRNRVLSVALTMAANGGDTLSVFVALFAQTRRPFTPIILITGLCMSLLWCLLASWMIRRKKLGNVIQKIGVYLLPTILISVGIYVLSSAPTGVFKP
jgi:cadmium resistance protein CadD (predicted permease)